MDKGEEFWHRILLASEIMDHINHTRGNSQNELFPNHENHKEITIIPDFRTDAATMIWEIMKPYEKLRATALLALSDAESLEFDLTSSVPTSDYLTSKRGGDDERLAKFGNFEKLRKTRLLKHTYHVVFYANSMKLKAGGNIGSLLLLALFHDFGKHPAIAADHKSQEWKKHEEISANYARTIMEKSGDFSSEYIESIVTIISQHHMSPVAGAPLYELLNEADAMARRYEASPTAL